MRALVVAITLSLLPSVVEVITLPQRTVSWRLGKIGRSVSIALPAPYGAPAPGVDACAADDTLCSTWLSVGTATVPVFQVRLDRRRAPRSGEAGPSANTRWICTSPGTCRAELRQARGDFVVFEVYRTVSVDTDHFVTCTGRLTALASDDVPALLPWMRKVCDGLDLTASPPR